MPIARSKKQKGAAQQALFDTEWTQDRIDENKLVNDIRRRVGLWRKGGYVGVTPTTTRLIAYWIDPNREKKLFFCQNEALETAIYLGLARTRMMAAKYPYYLLADSLEGIKKETKLTGKMPPEYKTEGDIKKGFVYKRVPHVTLKSIVNNPDIKEGMTRERIDAAIARHADTETLYNQPYPDNKRVRVCGPFSVESLSPHRVLSTGDENQDGTVSEQEARKQQDFATMILDNLKKAGVQNTLKTERLTFDRLDPYAGAWLHAAGEYTDAKGKARRVAVSIGPEHGTVGPQQVKEAAKEAVQSVGFDVLVVCGFAFDLHVTEEVKRYGKLTVLPTKMNPDLAMGDELLKKTGAGNLFMVFGEPDVEITKQKDGQIIAEIKGVDVYDPTTGQIRSASTDDIVCFHRHGLQRRELLRAPGLLHRGR